jgi:hypothetical protein
MKKLLQTIILLAVLAFAEVSNNTAKAQNNVDTVCAAVSPTNLNVLYYGAPNPLEIAVAGYKSDDIQVSMSRGTISKVQGELGMYVAVVPVSGDYKSHYWNHTDILIQSNGKILATKRFRLKFLPTPTAVVGNNGSVKTFSKQELLLHAGVKAVIDNFDFDCRFDVISFTVSATIDGEVRSESSNSAVFTAAQKKLFSEAPSGSKVSIFDIKAKGSDGSVRDLQPLIFELQ